MKMPSCSLRSIKFGAGDLFFTKRRLQENAFKDVIERWAVFVRATLRQIDPRMGSADLEELEQDVRMKLWQVLVTDGQFDKPAAFIRKLVLNVSIDAARKRIVRGGDLPHTSLSEPGSNELVGADILANETMEYRVELAQLADALMASNPDTAQALSLYLQGFSTDEIAKLLGWTEAKARNAVYRLIERQRLLKVALESGSQAD